MKGNGQKKDDCIVYFTSGTSLMLYFISCEITHSLVCNQILCVILYFKTVSSYNSKNNNT